jgi:hypothetical protein
VLHILWKGWAGEGGGESSFFRSWVGMRHDDKDDVTAQVWDELIFYGWRVDSIHINTSPVAPFNMIKIKVSKYACNVKVKL